jgi:hypothetical protein
MGTLFLKFSLSSIKEKFLDQSHNNLLLISSSMEPLEVVKG